ncbi:MAG: tripartite tricarboxylate transporter permease [Deltaproteobacteria bacterium]|jgi:putative tricarboxylic transport membrane protein|nr:tripartite tricarboxylate transporter permease [Deltaproteobacteria bacterium]
MLTQALDLLSSMPMSFFWMVLGVEVGIVFGAIPGLSATMAIAIFLPVTYGLSTVEGMACLVGLFVGGISGGLISAVLLNMPGTPASVATCFDGNPMAAKGQADKALGAGILFSFFGTVFGNVALVFIAPALAGIAIKFGPHEYFAVTFFSMSLIITLASDSLQKGLISGLLGFTFAMVGLDAIEASPRFTMDFRVIRSGFNVLTVLIGLYAVAEVLTNCEKPDDTDSAQILADVKMRGVGIGLKEALGQTVNFVRSAVIGLFIGILPGIGGGTSNIVAYTVAKNQSKHPERFGKGELSGVVASESANNAGIGGAMIPMLTLGIPGDTTTAMLLGGLMIHGVTPGPLIFETHGSLMYAIFVLLALSSLTMLVTEFLGLRLFIKVLKVPKYYLLPVIVALCAVGAFGLNSRVFDVGSVLFFGLAGYLLSKCGYPLPPLILGFILGPILELNLRRGLTSSQGNFLDFFTRPIAGCIIVFTLLFIAYSLFKVLRTRPSSGRDG